MPAVNYLTKKAKHRAPAYNPWQPAPGSEIFQALPNQIRALRYALGWSMRQLGLFLGLSIRARPFYDCSTVRFYEKGRFSPHRSYTEKMARLAFIHKEKYRRYLAVLPEGPQGDARLEAHLRHYLPDPPPNPLPDQLPDPK